MLSLLLREPEIDLAARIAIPLVEELALKYHCASNPRALYSSPLRSTPGQGSIGRTDERITHRHHYLSIY